MASVNFADVIAFTRASGGGRFNASGVYEYVGNNVPRLDYDPVTLQPKGLLIEEQRTNLLTYSEQFDNAVWIKSNSSVTPNTASAPDGLLTADAFIENTAASEHHWQRNSVSVSAGQAYTASIYVKQIGAARTCRFFFFDANSPFTTFGSALLNLSTGVVSLVTGSAVATQLADGWWRLQVTGTPTVTSIHIRCGIYSSTGVASYTGDGTSGIYIWGAQLEAGAFPTSYIPTVASQVTRSADVASVNTLSPWYNATEGTLFAEYVANSSYPTAGKAIVFAALSDNSYSNRISLASSTGTAQLNFDIKSAGTEYRTIAGNLSQGISKIAGAYKAADSSMVSLNGSLVSGPGAPTLPALSKLNVGASHDGSAVINGHIRSIRYYPRRLSNTELQEITA